MSLRHLPNMLCVLRMLLVYPLAQWILQGRYPEVLALFAVAAFTDALDGSLAKRFGWTSELGKHLDPLADKLLLVTMFLCLSMQATRAVVAHGAACCCATLVIVFGGAHLSRALRPVHGNPTIASKTNTLTQILFCLAVVAAAGYDWPPAWAITALGALVFVSTCVSGLDYVLIYSRRAAAVVQRAPRSGG